jgi:ABC-type bacteriocin/lantibiotic exporter with double-glycine peptidase domain
MASSKALAVLVVLGIAEIIICAVWTLELPKPLSAFSKLHEGGAFTSSVADLPILVLAKNLAWLVIGGYLHSWMRAMRFCSSISTIYCGVKAALWHWSHGRNEILIVIGVVQALELLQVMLAGEERQSEDDEGIDKLEEGLLAKEEAKKKKHASASRLFALAKPEAGILTGATVALMLGTTCQMAAPALFGHLIDIASKDGTQAQLNKTAAELGLFFMLSAVFTFIRGSLYTLCGERVVARLRRDLFTHMTHQEIAFFDQNKTGELTNRLASDTSVIQNAVTINVSMGLRFLAQLLICLVALFVISWKLTLVMLAIVPLLVLSAAAYGRFIRRMSKEYQDALAGASDVATESLGNIRTVRAFGMEPAEGVRYAEHVDKSYR